MSQPQPAQPVPRRGEVWQVDLNPVRGSEQGKARPVVVLTEPPTGRATVRLCVPIMHSKPEHLSMTWCAHLMPDATNGLTKDSTADTAQTRALDVVRFRTRLGQMASTELDAVTNALIVCVGRRPAPTAPKDGEAT